MTVMTVDVDMDYQKCAQCGKRVKGCYVRKDGTYICNKCVIKNIKNAPPAGEEE